MVRKTICGFPSSLLVEVKISTIYTHIADVMDQGALEHLKLDVHCPEVEITVGQWPFSDQFSPFGQANPIC